MRLYSIISFLLLSTNLMAVEKENLILKKTSCFVTYAGQLISMKERSVPQEYNYRYIESPIIGDKRVVISLTGYKNLAEAKLKIVNTKLNTELVESRGYLMLGPFDGIGLSFNEFNISCTYEP